MRRLLPGLLLLCLLEWNPTESAAAPPVQVLTRVFFHDAATETIKWADLLAGEKPTMGPVRTLAGFPQLDPQRQSIVSLQAAGGMLLAGIRDTTGGTAPRGWVLVECGVYEEAHGDHAHWIYPTAPRIRAAAVDPASGNPRRIHVYDATFYLTYDDRGEFLRIDPASIGPRDDAAAIRRLAARHVGGGRQGALAAVGKVVAFTAWEDVAGPHQGQIDVTALRPTGNDAVTFSFQLPQGELSALTAHYGKVFIVTPEALAWVTVPSRISSSLSSLPARQIPWDGPAEFRDEPRGFATYGRYLAYVGSSQGKVTLNYLDAAAEQPRILRLPVSPDADRIAGDYELFRNRKGQPLALVTHEDATTESAPGRLSVVELDPDRNGDWTDARVVQEISLGPAAAGEHRGIAVEADNRRALFTNPGDGTLMVLSVEDRKVVTGFQVGGTPTRVLAVGGRVSNH